MGKRQGTWELGPFEQCARDRLEPILGPLRPIDPGGGPTPVHDLEADLPGGSIAAIEVTSEVESDRLDLESSAARIFSSFSMPGSACQWLVGLEAKARVKAVRGALRGLLSDIEIQGVRSVNSRGDYRDALVKRLRELKIGYVYSFKSTGPKSGTVVVGPDSYSGRGWYGAATGAWLADFLASPLGVNKLAKLTNANAAAERHLVIVLHPFSEAGMSIPLGLTDRHEPGAAEAVIPTFVPPEPVTNLWLIPMVVTWEGLSWARGSGWAVLSTAKPD